MLRLRSPLGSSNIRSSQATLHHLGHHLPLVAVTSLLILLAAAVAAPPAAAQRGMWTWRGGPEGANASAIGVDPSNPDVLYAGTESSGMYKSINGGAQWSPINRGLPESAGEILSVVVNSRNTQEVFLQSNDGIYLSTDGGQNWVAQPSGRVPTIFDAHDNTMYGAQGAGLFSSIDGGFTWGLVGGVPDSAGIGSLARDPSNPAIFYASNYHAVWKSSDGGATFGRLTAPIDSAGAGLTHLATDPGAPGTVYLATSTQFWKSTDFGASWRPASQGLRGLRNHRRVIGNLLAASSASRVTLYALLTGIGSSPEVFRSEDGAATWVDQGPLPFESFLVAVAVSPSSPGILYSGTLFDATGVFRSSDGGRSWQTAAGGFAGPLFGIVSQPGARGGLYALGGSATWKSTDGGTTWKSLGRRLDALQVDPAEPGTLDAIQGGGFTSSADGGATWSKVRFPPSCLALLQIAVVHSPQPTIYAFTTTTENDCPSTPALSSTDGGRSWREVPALSKAFLLAFDHAGTLYAVRFKPLESSEVIKSTDGGKSWSTAGPIPGTSSFNQPNALAVSPVPGGDLYLTFLNQPPLVSHDGGASWEPVGAIPAPPFTSFVVVPDPLSSTTAYAFGGKSLLRTGDGGTGWSSPARGLTRAFGLSALTVSADGTVYIATSNGVFSLAQ